ncbi:unnamed protein product [Spirodela intermedia]|uniref:Uncharacterized protein n=1 Tax=Spirodela intermedia TaxID=51605 RepID=A0A7I8LHC6_SPIIN|nr:unnamed protein product [Spirodela intermedia]
MIAAVGAPPSVEARSAVAVAVAVAACSPHRRPHQVGPCG